MLPSSSSSSSSSSDHRPRPNCPICGDPSTGFYFGVPSCRACASFYRRSALEQRQYVCRRGGQCVLHKDGMRNSCRACRLKKCITAGMSLAKLDFGGIGGVYADSVTRSNNNRILGENGDNQIAKVDKLQLNLSIELQYPNAEKFLKSLRNIECGIKAIVTVLDVDETCGTGRIRISDQQPQLITYEKLMQIDRGCISLQLAMMREHFPAFDELTSVDNKVAIMKSFGLQLHFFRVADLTLRAFPAQNELTKLVMHWGCMIERDRMEHFFTNVEGNIQERIRVCQPIWDIWHSFLIGRYRPLDVSQMEMSALIGIMFWNCIERVLPNCSAIEIAPLRNALFVELHGLVAQRCSDAAAELAVRLGQLHALLQEVSLLAWQMEETITMFKLFLPPLHHCWDSLAELLGAESASGKKVEERAAKTE